jgi:hypothetical protein
MLTALQHLKYNSTSILNTVKYASMIGVNKKILILILLL